MTFELLQLLSLASPHTRHKHWTACLESKGCVRECGTSCYKEAKRTQKHRNLLPPGYKPQGTRAATSWEASMIPKLSECCYNASDAVDDCWTEVPESCAKFRKTPAALYWRCRRQCDAAYLRADGEAGPIKSELELCYQTAELACGEQLRADGLLAPLLAEHSECKRLAMLYAGCPANGEHYFFDVAKFGGPAAVTVAADPAVVASPDWPPPCERESDSDVDGCWNLANHSERASGRARLADWRTADSKRLVELLAFWVHRYQEALLLRLIDEREEHDPTALQQTLADAFRPFERWLAHYGDCAGVSFCNKVEQKDIVRRAVRHKVIATPDADRENARDEIGVPDEHWRGPLEARRKLVARAEQLKARAMQRQRDEL